jgi:hypothetical protein
VPAAVSGTAAAAIERAAAASRFTRKEARAAADALCFAGAAAALLISFSLSTGQLLSLVHPGSLDIISEGLAAGSAA